MRKPDLPLPAFPKRLGKIRAARILTTPEALTDTERSMTWLERIAECVQQTMDEQDLTRQQVAGLAHGAGIAAVDAVRKAENPTSSSIDAVVAALGLVVVADCVPNRPDLENFYHLELARLREAAIEQGRMGTTEAEELLQYVHTLITTGHARAALRALLTWRANQIASEEQSQDTPQTVSAAASEPPAKGVT
jgi:hypothetical protein